MTCDSVITCPFCGFGKQERMPDFTRVGVYECPRCGEVLMPKRKTDCCVFCAYGSVRCPSRQ